MNDYDFIDYISIVRHLIYVDTGAQGSRAKQHFAPWTSKCDANSRPLSSFQAENDSNMFSCDQLFLVRPTIFGHCQKPTKSATLEGPGRA